MAGAGLSSIVIVARTRCPMPPPSADDWKNRGLVDDRHLSYFLHWLKRYLFGARRAANRHPQDALTAFWQELEPAR
jgi:hypothetical protein